jgi:hypothetical protein
MKWADKIRRLKVRTNADRPDQSANAIAFGGNRSLQDGFMFLAAIELWQ